MNGDNIYMDLPAVDSKIAILKEERDVMKTSLDQIKDEILKMPEVWNGNTGDDNYEVLIKYSRNFTDIIDKIDSYIDALQLARDRYERLDKAIDERAEENAGISAV